MVQRPHIVNSIPVRPHCLIIVVAIFAFSIFGAKSAVAKTAAQIYHEICTPCHGARGEGKKLMAPPLKNNDFVTKNPDEVVKDTIKNGRYGMDKLYPEYPSPMPSRKYLGDEDLDGLVKYIKTVIQN